jgi:4-coumarate--CoA ligase
MAPAAQLTSRDLSAANNVEPMPSPVSGFAQLGKVSLPRTGQRPLVFEGEEIVSATSCAPGPRFWYEINLYRKQDRSLVIDIRFFGKPTELKDRFRSFSADSLDDVTHILETYDPALDIHADIPVHDDSVPVSLIALQAAMVRMQIDEARRQFKDLAGEILHQIDVQSSRGYFATVAEPPISPCDAVSIRRIVTALIADEIGRATQRRIAPASVAAWTDSTAIDEEGVGVDSLLRLECALRVNEFFHLHEVGSEDYLLVRRTIGDWVEVVAETLKRQSRAITVRTSGSTGTPKKCTHLVADLDAEVIEFGQIVGHRRRIAALVPPHHIYGFLHTVRLALHLGVETVDLRSSGPGGWNCAIAPGDLVVATPHLWSLWSETGQSFPADVVGVTSTAPMPPVIAGRLKALGLTRLIEIYGSSESGGIAWRDDPAAPFRLFDFWQVEDEGRALVRAGGEPIRLEDVLNWTGDRSLQVGPRKDGSIQIAGTNVNPSDVVRRLCQHEAIVDCVVRAQRDADPARARLEAFIVTQTPLVDEIAFSEELVQWCARIFQPAERPVAFRFGSAIPRDFIGKPALW